MNKTSLLETLYNSEALFVEEIYRLEKFPEQVGFIGGGDGVSGLICLTADEDSFDWNIVRILGDISKCQGILSAIPFDDYVLIGGVADKDCNDKSLMFFESSASYGQDENEDFQLNRYANAEFGLHKDAVNTRVSQIDSRLDDIYLCQGEDILGFIKVTRCSWHYAEVAVEVNSQFRNQGWGTVLLALMVEQARRKNVKLCYVVESDNIASISIAYKCGLRYLTSLLFKSSNAYNY